MKQRPELVAAAALLCLYLAVMSGHLFSIDGLLMWRQALALAYHHSWTFVPPIWWGGWLNSSYRGLGASGQYVPSALLFFWLSSHVPVSPGPVDDFGLYYKDILYLVAGAPVWAVLTAASAWLVGLTTRAAGGGRRLALWSIALYGLGSPAFAASRGDWPQPIVALCWIAGVYGCLRFRETARPGWLWLSAVALFYGVLTRPLEGSLLLPALFALLYRQARKQPQIAVGQGAAWLAAVVVTVLTNWARFGSPTNLGYAPSNIEWTTPIWIGLPGDLISPGRGILWEFPAIVLAALGLRTWWLHGKRLDAIAFGGVSGVLLIEASLYHDWAGGWDWGFRFFQPALPLLAVLAGVGIASLASGGVKSWAPPFLLVVGVVWNIPVIVTNLLAGYGSLYADLSANWRIEAYPPIGAWVYLHHLFPRNAIDSASVDIVWFRAWLLVGPAGLLPFVALLVGFAWLWWRAVTSAAPAPPMGGGEPARLGADGDTPGPPRLRTGRDLT